jgi:hypothetical protein
MTEHWIFYDDRRPLLRFAARWLAGLLVRRGFRPAPLHRGWSQDRLNLPVTACPSGLHVLTGDGRTLRGATAFGYVLRNLSLKGER